MAVTVRKEIELPNLLVSPYFTAADGVFGPLNLTYTAGQPNSVPAGTKFVIVKLINVSGGGMNFGARPWGSVSTAYNLIPTDACIYVCLRLNENAGVPCLDVRCAYNSLGRLYLLGWSDRDTFLTTWGSYNPSPVGWQTNDLTADANYIGAWFHMQAKGYAGGLRKNGATDAYTFTLTNAYYAGGACGLDANGNCQLYGQATGSQVAYRLTGFFHTDDWGFNTNFVEIATDKSAGQLGDWRTAEVGVAGAKAAIVAIWNTSSGEAAAKGAVRAAGASDNQQDYSVVGVSAFGPYSYAIVACDELGRIEVWRETADVEFWLVGWVKGTVEKFGYDYACALEEGQLNRSTGQSEDEAGLGDEATVSVVKTANLSASISGMGGGLSWQPAYLGGQSDSLQAARASYAAGGEWQVSSLPGHLRGLAQTGAQQGVYLNAERLYVEASRAAFTAGLSPFKGSLPAVALGMQATGATRSAFLQASGDPTAAQPAYLSATSQLALAAQTGFLSAWEGLAHSCPALAVAGFPAGRIGFQSGSRQLMLSAARGYPVREPRERLQVVSRTAAGTLRVADKGAATRRLRLWLPSLPQADQQALTDWFENVAVGALNPFTFVDESGASQQVRWTGGLNIERVSAGRWSGEIVLEVVG